MHDFRLRFEAPYEDRLAYARMLMSKRPGTVWNEPEYHQLIRADGTYYTDRLFEKLPWWDLHTVRRGVQYSYAHFESAGARAPFNAATILVDLDSPVLYYWTSD